MTLTLYHHGEDAAPLEVLTLRPNLPAGNEDTRPLNCRKRMEEEGWPVSDAECLVCFGDTGVQPVCEREGGE